MADQNPSNPLPADVADLDAFYLPAEEDKSFQTPLDMWWDELNADPDLVESWDMGPPSTPPDVRRLRDDIATETMVKWFQENFEDPAGSTPHDEGEYVYIWGGPCDAREELDEVFGATASEQAIEAAVAEIEHDGWEWAPAESRMQPEAPLDPIVDVKRKLMAVLRAWRARAKYRGQLKP